MNAFTMSDHCLKAFRAAASLPSLPKVAKVVRPTQSLAIYQIRWLRYRCETRPLDRARLAGLPVAPYQAQIEEASRDHAVDFHATIYEETT